MISPIHLILQILQITSHLLQILKVRTLTSIHLPYYYLHPGIDNEMDYANVGIPQDDQFPDKFKLYDVTRRALNCLTLLYTNPEDSLTPLTVSYYQQQLLQNISSL